MLTMHWEVLAVDHMSQWENFSFAFVFACQHPFVRRVNLNGSLEQFAAYKAWSCCLSDKNTWEGVIRKSRELQQTLEEGRGLRRMRPQVCITYWAVGECFKPSFSFFILAFPAGVTLPFLQVSDAEVMLCVYIYLNTFFVLDFIQNFHTFAQD